MSFISKAPVCEESFKQHETSTKDYITHLTNDNHIIVHIYADLAGNLLKCTER
jgi:hypothetical protein